MATPGCSSSFPVVPRRGATAAGQLRDKSGQAPAGPTRDRPGFHGLAGRARRPRAKGGKRGAIYARYSSRFQHSIQDQIRACREWADANGIEIDESRVFFDEKTSGKKNRRAGFQALMRAVLAEEVDVVIIFTTNRLFRKTYRSLKFVEEEICDRRKRCVFIKSGVDTADKENWRKLLHLHSLVDELTVTLQAAHIRAAHEGQLRLGVVFGTLTYGFTGEAVAGGGKTKRGNPTRKLVIDPVTAEWVKKIFAWFVDEEMSIADIVRRLNEERAPLPLGAKNARWTYLIVRRMLDYARYRGQWQYGATEVVWQNKADYARQFKRERPLAVVELPDLRLVDERTWHAAQRRLADYHGRAGRKSKDGDRGSRPMLLNGLCYCEKHRDTRLIVGGANGTKMFCRACLGDPERALYTMLPRTLATELLCAEVARLLRTDGDLVVQAIASARQQAEQLGKPDEQKMAEAEQRIARLTENIKFVMKAPTVTEEDEAENRQRLLELRTERAKEEEQLARLKEAAGRAVKVPTEKQVRDLLERLAVVLTEAAGSDDGKKVAAARRILEAVTGGRIVISQQGERKPKHGWLRGTFELRLIKPVLDGLGLDRDGDVPAKVIDVDFKAPDPMEELANLVKPLWDQGLLVKKVAKDLSVRLGHPVSRNLVTKALAHWFTSRGLPVPDGRTRRATLTQKGMDPFLYEKIADAVMELFDQGVLLGDIAQRMGVDRNTVTAAVRVWHERRGLPVPDGRTRRKALEYKGRGRSPDRDAA